MQKKTVGITSEVIVMVNRLSVFQQKRVVKIILVTLS
jgi:hypothetical protein